MPHVITYTSIHIAAAGVGARPTPGLEPRCVVGAYDVPGFEAIAPRQSHMSDVKTMDVRLCVGIPEGTRLVTTHTTCTVPSSPGASAQLWAEAWERGYVYCR